MSKVVFLVGEGEYGSAESLRWLADELSRDGHEVVYRVSDVLADMPDFPQSSFGDLSVLDDAELLVLFIRFRQLPDEEMAALQRYVDRGGDILAFRTTSHPFRFDPASPWAGWNRFGEQVLGTGWISHHGRDTSTEVTVTRTDHPVTRSLPARFPVRSWLYRVSLLPDCEVLLEGVSVGDPDDPEPQPLAWVRAHRGGRIVFTTVGHAGDFDSEHVRRLLLNAAGWLTGPQ